MTSDTVHPISHAPQNPGFRFALRGDLTPGTELYVTATVPTDEGCYAYPDKLIRVSGYPTGSVNGDERVLYRQIYPELDGEHYVYLADMFNSRQAGDLAPQYWIKL